MGNKLTLSVFFVILLLIVSIGGAGFYFVSYESQKKINKQLENELSSAREQKDKILKQLDAINKEKISLESKVKENEIIIANLNDKLTKEVNARETLMKEQKGLQDKIIAVGQEKKKAEDALSQKLKELTQLQNKLDTAILEKNELEKKITAGSKGATEDLEKIIVTPLGPEAEIKEQRQPLSSNVLLINREYGFLVLDIGKPSGVELGDVFEVSHENASIGKVRVEKIHDTMSAANFLEDFKTDQVSEGDIANRIN